MHLAEILHPSAVVLDIEGSEKPEILRQLAQGVCAVRPEIDVDALVEVLVQRELASSTAIADGIAIPHGKINLEDEVIAAFGLCRTGLDFASVDGQPTRLFFLLVSPESHPSSHLRWLAHIAGLLKSMEFREALLAAETAEDVLAAAAGAEQAALASE